MERTGARTNCTWQPNQGAASMPSRAEIFLRSGKTTPFGNWKAETNVSITELEKGREVSGEKETRMSDL